MKKFFFKEFVPSYYKKPKAVPTPEEDRTRTALQKEVFLGDATIDGKPVSYETPFKVLAEWIRSAKKPAVVEGKSPEGIDRQGRKASG
jgi:lipoate-protein ligase A